MPAAWTAFFSKIITGAEKPNDKDIHHDAIAADCHTATCLILLLNRRSVLSNCQVFFDFDNTITDFDVLDGIIEQFSVNRDWVAYEEAWKKGKIGSRQCLEGQLRSIRVERAQLHDYLKTVTSTLHSAGCWRCCAGTAWSP